MDFAEMGDDAGEVLSEFDNVVEHAAVIALEWDVGGDTVAKIGVIDTGEWVSAIPADGDWVGPRLQDGASRMSARIRFKHILAEVVGDASERGDRSGQGCSKSCDAKCEAEE